MTFIVDQSVHTELLTFIHVGMQTIEASNLQSLQRILQTH